MYESVKFQDISIKIISDDLVLPFLGGNKARKLLKIEKEIASSKKNAIVTTGGIQSNHCRVAALVCAKNGWKCKLILHGNEQEFYKQNGNALIMRMCGAEIQFVTPAEIGSSMDKSMEDLKNRGYSPYYLYGGGHNKLGVAAYIDVIHELFDELGVENQPNHIFLPSGTGSTQAGILLGLEQVGWNATKVHGISVARIKAKGTKGVLEGIQFIKHDFDASKVLFYDDFLFGGYGAYNKELQKFIVGVAKKYGLILDTTYSGKAYYGMLKLIQKEKLTGNILFWHTGGLLNLMA